MFNVLPLPTLLEAEVPPRVALLNGEVLVDVKVALTVSVMDVVLAREAPVGKPKV